jgi:molecular chaperone DnaK (HSP70)
VKLLLSPISLTNRASSEENVVESTRMQLKKLKKTAVDVISDYLRFLWRHILERLRIRLTAPVLDNMAFKIVLTVPAIWDHNAQQQMITAATRAGMLDYRLCGKTEINLLAELEAVALATHFDSWEKLNLGVKVGPLPDYTYMNCHLT